MSASIVQRLLWKEYRVQRGLWLALFLITVVMQVLMFFMLSSPASRNEDFLVLLVGVGIFLGGFYAFGSGCITFAGEREDDTHIRAVSMVYPPALTLLLKMLFGIITTTAFVALTTVIAYLFRGHELERLLGYKKGGGPDWVTVLAWVTCLMLTAQSWGVCCSLLTRRVLTAMFAAAVATCATFTFVVNFAALMPRFSPSQYDPNRDQVVLPFIVIFTVMGLAGMFAVNLLLTRRWLNRDFADGPRVRRSWLWFLPRVRFVRISDDGTLVIPISPGQDDYLPVLSPDVAAIQPPPRSIRNWLGMMNLGRGRKTFGFLVWRELVETRRTFWLGIALLIVLQKLTLDRNISTNLWMLEIELAVVALSCGFMTFRQEQADNQHRFLTFRGTPAAQLWLSKHVVWMSRLVIGCAVLITSTILIVDYEPEFQTLVNIARPGLSDIGSKAIALLTFFAIGQTASLFIRKGIISAFATVLAGVVFGGWLLLTSRFFVPVWLSALPLALGLMLATFLRCRPWMMECNTLGSWYRPVLVCIASVAACLSLTGVYRTTEIPDVGTITNRPRLVGSFFDPTLPATATEQDVAELLKPLTDAERQTAQIYRDAVELLSRDGEPFTLLHSEFSGERTAAGAQALRQFAASKRDALALGLQAATQAECAFWHPAKTFSVLDWQETEFAQFGFRRLVALTLVSAERELEERHPETSLDRYVAALAMCRHLEARGVSLGWSHSRDHARIVFEALRQWAGSESVTKPMLDRAAAEVRRHRSLMLTPEARNIANHFAERTQLKQDFDSLIDQAGMHDDQKFFARVLFKLPGERERLRRLMILRESRSSADNAALTLQVSVVGTRQTGFQCRSYLDSYRIEQLRILAAGNPMEGLPLLTVPHFKEVIAAMEEELAFETQLRATLLTLHLLAEYRGRELPESLDLPAIRELGLVDPWSGREFILFADGLPKEARFIRKPELVEDDLLPQPFFISNSESRREFGLMRFSVDRPDLPGMGGGAAVGFPNAIDPEQPLAAEQTELVLVSRDPIRGGSWQTASLSESPIYLLPKGVFQPRAVPAWRKLLERNGQPYR